MLHVLSVMTAIDDLSGLMNRPLWQGTTYRDTMLNLVFSVLSYNTCPLDLMHLIFNAVSQRDRCCAAFPAPAPRSVLTARLPVHQSQSPGGQRKRCSLPVAASA